MVDISSIPSPDGKYKVFYNDGNTQNIIRVILLTDQKEDDRFCEFSKQFTKDEEGLNSLWRFVRYKIKYKKDPFGEQNIKTPAALWKDKVGDCKSKTLFITQVLRCLNIPYIIRFTSYRKGADVQHVYPIAVLNGRQIILDSVYHYFNKEKKPAEIKDFNMTKIAQISGVEGPLTSSLDSQTRERANKILKEVEQIQSDIPRQEPLELRKLTVGGALLRLEKRKLELLREFSGNYPKKIKQFNQAISIVEDAIMKGHIGYKPSGIGVLNNISQAVSYRISKMMQDKRPAISFGNTIQAKSRSIGAIYPNWGGFNTKFSDLVLTGTNTYKFGAGTPYEAKFTDLVNPITSWLSQNKSSVVTNPDGSPKLFAQSMMSPTIGVPGPIYKFYDSSNNQVSNFTVVNNLNQVSESGKQQALLGSEISLGTYDLQQEFEKFIEESSGVWDKYLNQQVFKETNKTGSVLMYDWANDVVLGGKQLTINDYPQAVATKRIVQSTWLDAAGFLTGADRQVIKAMAENTYIYGVGEQPQTTLSTLVSSSSGIGVIDPITITTIIATLAPIIIGAIQAMVGSKTQADTIAPGRVPQSFTPLSLANGPEESDWLGGMGNGNGDGTGFNTNLLLGGALLGGALLMMNQE